MRPLDSGVIGAAPAGPDFGVLGALRVDVVAPGPIPDLPVGVLPADVPSFEPPAFVLARKEGDQGGPPVAGVPGPIPGGGSEPRTLGGVIAPALDGAYGVMAGAQAALGSAQDVLGSAGTALGGVQAAVDGVPAALDAAQAAFARAATDLVAPLPPLPADPVGDLMKGLALPAIPGLDALFAPFLQLLRAFGTGVPGRLSPTTLLSTGSKAIESAMLVGSGALRTVESLWQGEASQSAQASGRRAGDHGLETAKRGFALSAITDQAAAVVRRGNIQLSAIAQAFATEATALAPLILTPLGQTTLIASATRHLGEAVTVVNTAHGELSVCTAQVQGLIGQLVGLGGGPDPATVAQALVQNVARPLLEQAEDLLESGLPAATSTPDDPSRSNSPGELPDTSATGVGGGGGLGHGGGAGGLGAGMPSAPGGPGSSVPGGRITNPANQFGVGAGGVPGPGLPAGSGFLGSPAVAGAGKGGAGDAPHGRTVQPHRSPTAESELTGNLGTVAPGVLGDAEDPADAELDQL
ncbi:hypothetical protein ABZ412_32675 [Nocardia sp. NPDC005746]|uniref:hypothetical protein n=1 Tax=Nocardia sp. NPDC005746 TaxID=3157062 RepID=UPI003409E2A4